MSELRIEGQALGTTQPAKREAKNKNENIVIEFSSLPSNMNTKKVRAFYDKDGSVFLESKNANGVNEVDLMQRAFNLDLSKYKSDVVKVKSEHSNGYSESYGYNNKGEKIVEIQDYNPNNLISEIKYNHKKQGFSLGYDNETKNVEAIYNYDQNYQKNNSAEISGRDKVTRYYFKDGYQEVKELNYNPKTDMSDDIELGVYKNNGKKLSDSLGLISTKISNLVKGKNRIQKREAFRTDLATPDNNMTISEAAKKGKTEKVKTTMLLNGVPVNAKRIGKGRWEVTDGKGKVFYISHDGQNLKPEYVRKNP